MTSHSGYAEEPPRPLSESERRIFDGFVQAESSPDMDSPIKTEEQILDQMLADAPHFDLRSLSPGSRLTLIGENDYEFSLSFIGWKDEKEFDPTRPLLARLDVSAPVHIASEVYSDLVIVDGASIGEHMRPEDKLTVAQNCNFRYFNVARQLYLQTKDPRPKSEIESLLREGKIVFDPTSGVPIERIAIPEVKFTPPIVACRNTLDGTSIF